MSGLGRVFTAEDASRLNQSCIVCGKRINASLKNKAVRRVVLQTYGACSAMDATLLAASCRRRQDKGYVHVASCFKRLDDERAAVLAQEAHAAGVAPYAPPAAGVRLGTCEHGPPCKRPSRGTMQQQQDNDGTTREEPCTSSEEDPGAGGPTQGDIRPGPGVCWVAAVLSRSSPTAVHGDAFYATHYAQPHRRNHFTGRCLL